MCVCLCTLCPWCCRSAWGAGQAVGEEFFRDNHGESGRYFWYGEHDIDTSLAVNAPYAIDRKGVIFDPTLPSLQGGVYACSTSDFITWRNEGNMVRWNTAHAIKPACRGMAAT